MLKGKNIVLRPLALGDLKKINIWRNDVDLIKLTLGIRFPKTIEMEEEWFKEILLDRSNKNIYYGIEESLSGDFIGIVQLNNIDYISRHCEFGIMIPEIKNQKKGYATNAMEVLFNYALNVLNLRKICLKVVDYNKKAVKLYHNFGFKDEGILKEQIYFDNKYHDILLMALFI